MLSGITAVKNKLLEEVQVEAGRIITGSRCYFSQTKLYDELGWDQLQTRRKEEGS